MDLLNQIVGLVATVMGVIVAALAVPDPIWKRRTIIAIGAIGLLQLVFLILGWEKNQNTAYLLAALSGTWSLIAWFFSRPLFHGALIFAAGLFGGYWLTNTSRKRFGLLIHRLKRDRRVWLTSFQICQLAGRDLMTKRKAAIEAFDACERAYQTAEHNKDVVLGGFGSLALIRDDMPAELVLANKAATEATYKFHLASEELARLEQEIVDRIHAALEAGQLIARGFLPPFSAASTPVDIPAEQWRFLRFDKDYQKAVGHEVTYIGVAVHNPMRRSEKAD